MINCGFTPTEEEKIDWFLASIHERTYEAMHAHYINLQLQGTLTFGQMVKLYSHQCFARYPHFQVEDLNRDNKYLNNSTRFRGKGNKGAPQHKGSKGQGQYQRQEKGKGRGAELSQSTSGYSPPGARITVRTNYLHDSPRAYE